MPTAHARASHPTSHGALGGPSGPVSALPRRPARGRLGERLASESLKGHRSKRLVAYSHDTVRLARSTLASLQNLRFLSGV